MIRWWRVLGRIYRRTGYDLEVLPLDIMVYCEREKAESEATKSVSGLISNLKVETLNEKEANS